MGIAAGQEREQSNAKTIASLEKVKTDLNSAVASQKTTITNLEKVKADLNKIAVGGHSSGAGLLHGADARPAGPRPDSLRRLSIAPVDEEDHLGIGQQQRLLAQLRPGRRRARRDILAAGALEEVIKEGARTG